jgi:hypothetical protein
MATRWLASLPREPIVRGTNRKASGATFLLRKASTKLYHPFRPAGEESRWGVHAAPLRPKKVTGPWSASGRRCSWEPMAWRNGSGGAPGTRHQHAIQPRGRAGTGCPTPVRPSWGHSRGRRLARFSFVGPAREGCVACDRIRQCPAEKGEGRGVGVWDPRDPVTAVTASANTGAVGATMGATSGGGCALSLSKQWVDGPVRWPSAHHRSFPNHTIRTRPGGPGARGASRKIV